MAAAKKVNTVQLNNRTLANMYLGKRVQFKTTMHEEIQQGVVGLPYRNGVHINGKHIQFCDLEYVII